ncbi:MAG: DUF4037 domain-containing protein, partial [Firmicutes bacterium]|nr:DUF4037 domain-containing protein [Bacillota bacterium]
ELSRKYYEEYGAPMLASEFSSIRDRLAVGLAGAGSECFGFDDDVSQDHDFEPGFCIFLPGEDVVDRQTAFRLERAYNALPKEFMGFKRSFVSPVGGKRRGVLRTEEFYAEHTGFAAGPRTPEEWLRVPEYALAEVTNGDVFEDNYGEFSAVRAALLDMPEDARLKKLAGRLLLMAQSGQYNYERCLAHGETGAAQLALFEFVKNALSAAFLINRRYMPFYKWAFRAMRDLPALAETAGDLEYLISTANAFGLEKEKAVLIEKTASAFITQLQEQGITDAICLELEKHAYSVNDHVKDNGLRTANVLSAV